MKLLDLVHPKAILAELPSRDRNGVIRELVQALADAGQIDAGLVEGIARSIVARERKGGTTGIGKGVAVPHAKVDGVARVMSAVGRSSAGVDFASLDGAPVYCVLLILSPENQPELHLQAMELVFRHVQHERFRRFLRQSSTPEAIYDLLREADERLLTAP